MTRRLVTVIIAEEILPTRKPVGLLLLNGVLPPPYGGIARHMRHLIPTLAQQGYRVWTVMPRDYTPYDYPELRVPGVEVMIPREPANPGRWTLYYPRLLKIYARYGKWIAHRYLNHRSSFERKRVQQTLLDYLPETDDLLRQHLDEIDIIQAFDRPWWQGWIGQILAEKYKKRLIITVFGEMVPHVDLVEQLDETSEPFRTFSAEVMRRADRITSMTRYCAELVTYLGLDPKVVYPLSFVSGMEEFIETPNDLPVLYEQYPMLKGKRIVLFIGQLQKRKAPDLLLRAGKAIVEQHPDVMLVIVGPDYGMRAELDTLTQTLGIADRTLITGAVSQELLRAFYHAAAMFTFTTISQIECLGLVFVQAMYAHCAVIAANISGVPEVIRHGENGLLFEPGDVDTLQKHILTLLNDTPLRERLREQAFNDVTRQFADEVLLDQIRALYTFDETQ
jgi:glycosyltransferase involved in cell wall biosynthesis